MSLDQVFISTPDVVERRKVDYVSGASRHTLNPHDAEISLQLAALLPDVVARGGRVVICGGSLTGILAAVDIADQYPDLNVSLVTRDVLGEKLSEQEQARIRRSLAHLGIEVLDQLEIVRVGENTLHFKGGRPMPFDIAIWAV